jgi:hypothetical protein
VAAASRDDFHVLLIQVDRLSRPAREALTVVKTSEGAGIAPSCGERPEPPTVVVGDATTTQRCRSVFRAVSAPRSV